MGAHAIDLHCCPQSYPQRYPPRNAQVVLLWAPWSDHPDRQKTGAISAHWHHQSQGRSFWRNCRLSIGPSQCAPQLRNVSGAVPPFVEGAGPNRELPDGGGPLSDRGSDAHDAARSSVRRRGAADRLVVSSLDPNPFPGLHARVLPGKGHGAEPRRPSLHVGAVHVLVIRRRRGRGRETVARGMAPAVGVVPRGTAPPPSAEPAGVDAYPEYQHTFRPSLR